MSYSTGEPDYTALPIAMLDLARFHMRVAFLDDDETILRYLRWAISYVELFTELRIFPVEVVWTPDVVASRAQCPMQPVSTFTAAVDALDVSNQYRLERSSLTAPVWLVRIDGTDIEAGLVATLAVGYADANKIPPALEGNILRTTATLYENRESISAISLDQVPTWLNDNLTGLWVPRA